MSKRKFFLLVGHSGSSNRGCEAILRTTVVGIRKEFPNSQITVSSVEYQKDVRMHRGEGIKFIPFVATKFWKPFSRDWFLRKFHNRSGELEEWMFPYVPLIFSLKKADVVLSIGGDNYTEDYGDLDYYFKLNKIIKFFKKKLVIWSASIGPFLKISKQEIIQNLRLVDLATVREIESYQYLEGLGLNNIKNVMDVAFLLPCEPVIHFCPSSFLFDNNIVGFNISPLIRKYGKISREQILDHTCRFIQHIIAIENMKVILVPHVTPSDIDNNDFLFMKQILKKFEDNSKLFLVSDQYKAAQIKYIISKCRFFIGARTHSTIASLSSLIPTLSLAYSAKARGINRDIFGSLDYSLNIGDYCFENLFLKYQKLKQDESLIKDKLSKRMVEIKQESQKNFSFLKEILFHDLGHYCNT